MRRLWQFTAVLVAVLAIGATAFLLRPPAGIVNSKAAQIARGALGGDVEINGAPSFRFSPFAIRLEDVTVSNPTSAPAGTMIHAGTVEIEPTIVTSSWLVPSIDLAVVRIDVAQVRLGRSTAATTSTAAALPTGKPVEDPAPRLREVRLTRSTVLIQDAGSETVKLEGVDAILTRASEDAPIDLEIKTTVGKEPIAGTIRLEPLKTILAGGPIKTIARVSSSPGRGEFDGVVEGGRTVRVAGKARLDFPSLEILSSAIGLDPGVLGDGTGSFVGDVSVSQGSSSGARTETPAAGGAWEVGIKGGQIGLIGKPGQTSQKFDNVNATARFGGGKEAADVTADLTWAGERIEASTSVASWPALQKREKSGLSGRMSYTKGQIELTGDLIPGQDTTFLGRAKGTTKDLRGLTNLAGFTLPVDKGVEQVEVDGEVSINANTVKLWNAKLIVDNSTARGSLSIARGTSKSESPGLAARPLIGGKLTIDKLDASKYIPRFDSEPPKSDRADPKAKPANTQEDEDKKEPDRYSVRRNPFSDVETVPFSDTLRSQINRMSGREAPAAIEAPVAASPAWSEKPIGLAGLRKVDLDLDLTINEMQFGKRTLVVPNLKALLNDGRLTLEGKDIASHGGKLAGTAQIDAREKVPTLRTKLTADGVNVDQVFDDLGYATVLSGKAKMEADLTAKGDNEKDLISSLGGKIKTMTGKADVVGWDLRRDWRSYINQRSPGPYNSNARTPVERLVAGVKLTEGVAETEDIEVKGPDFGHVGTGSVNLVRQQADYRGRLAAFVQPPLDIPFYVSGPWSKLKAGLDESAGGLARVILSYLGIRWGSNLESAGAIEPEIESLAREYVEKASTLKNLTAEDAAALKELQDKLGLKTRQ